MESLIMLGLVGVWIFAMNKNDKELQERYNTNEPEVKKLWKEAKLIEARPEWEKAKLIGARPEWENKNLLY